MCEIPPDNLNSPREKCELSQKKTRPSADSVRPSCNFPNLNSLSTLDHVLEILQGTHFDDVPSRFGFEGGFFTRERVNPLPLFCRRFVLDRHFAQSVDRKALGATTAKRFTNLILQRVEDGSDFLLVHSRVVCDLREHFCFCWWFTGRFCHLN
jgi:hypothetical protein